MSVEEVRAYCGEGGGAGGLEGKVDLGSGEGKFMSDGHQYSPQQVGPCLERKLVGSWGFGPNAYARDTVARASFRKD